MTSALRIVLTAACAMLWCVPVASAGIWDGGSFTTDLPTSAPGNLNPSDATTLAYPADSLAFSWKAVPGTSKYQIMVARQDSGSADCAMSTAFASSKIIELRTVDEPAWIPTMTKSDGDELFTGTYCWRVRAERNGATAQSKQFGVWSSALRFTRTWSSVPIGLKFFDDASGTIPRDNESATAASTSTTMSGYLYWEAISGAASYGVEVYRSRSLASDSRLLVGEVRANRVLLPRLPDDQYFWRVRALDPAGVPGDWTSGSTSFTVAWTDSAWGSAANIEPDNGDVMTNMTLGWSPMQGAASYRVQAVTRPSCFGSNTTQGNPWGNWSNKSPESVTDSLTGITTYMPYPPAREDCVISPDNGVTTINNFMTSSDVIDDAVYDNVQLGYTKCIVTEPNSAGWKCVPPPVFTPGCAGTFTGGGPWPAHLDGTTSFMLPPIGKSPYWGGQTKTLKELMDRFYECDSGTGPQVYWRVRPEFTLSSDTEQSWEVTGEFNLNGRWVEAPNAFAGSGAVLPMSFAYEPDTAITSHAGSRCWSPDNDSNATNDGCLVMDTNPSDSDRPTVMAVNNIADDSTSHQFPLVTWSAFPGAQGYVVEIAHDANFNDIIVERATYDTQWIPATTLPDSEIGEGYWVRVTPCGFGTYSLSCLPLYYAASPGTYINTSDGTGAQFFDKRSDVTLVVNQDFSGTTPLLQMYRTGASSIAEQALGLASSSTYEFEYAKNPLFTSSITKRSSTPRFVPFEGVAGKKELLPAGVWYARARSICDKCSLTTADQPVYSGWSNTVIFSQDIPAPTIVGSETQTAVDATVRWSWVPGATSYKLEFSDDPSFQNPAGSVVTHQTQALLDAPSTGTWYWRVRANIGDVEGTWSAVDEDGPYVVIRARDIIDFTQSAQTVPAEEDVVLEGRLVRNGTGDSGEDMILQRKSTICNATSGSWSNIGTVNTGDTGEEGSGELATRIDRNRCYRWYWPTGDLYSAPIEVRSYPRGLLTTSRSSVRRGSNFTMTLRTNTAITGRVRAQYRIGSTWYTFATSNVTNAKVYTFNGRINRAGSLRLRAVLDRMVLSTGDQSFVDTQVGGPVIQVNDLWSSYS